jgi:hypothetical protein
MQRRNASWTSRTTMPGFPASSGNQAEPGPRPSGAVRHSEPSGAGVPLPLLVAGVAIVVVVMASAVAFRRA